MTTLLVAHLAPILEENEVGDRKDEFSAGSPVGPTCSDSAASRETTHRPDQHPQPDPNQQQVLHRRHSGKAPFWCPSVWKMSAEDDLIISACRSSS